MPGLDAYWAAYDATLARIRTEKPDSTDGVIAILNTFEPPSSGAAFFGNGADDHVDDALRDSSWDVRYIEGDYVWEAEHRYSGAALHYVEGDVYRGKYRA